MDPNDNCNDDDQSQTVEKPVYIHDLIENIIKIIKEQVIRLINLKLDLNMVKKNP